MKKIIYLTSIIILLSLVACKPRSESASDIDFTKRDAAHNSRGSVTWWGLYTGTIPCADCEGINVQITLNRDETYTLTYQYIGKSDTIYTFSGNFTWNDAGSIITLDNKNLPPHYQVGETKLFQLDLNKNRITGELADMYILRMRQ